MRAWIIALVLLGLMLAIGFSYVWSNGQYSLPLNLITCPAVSPSGDKIAFAAYWHAKRSPLVLWIYDTIGVEAPDYIEVRLVILSVSENVAIDTGIETTLGSGNVAWSANGNEVAFFNWENPTLAIAHLDAYHVGNRSVRRLASAPDWYIKTPHFSSDGKHVGWIEDHDHKQLVVRDLAKEQATIIGHTANHWSWCWNPDGSGLFYVKDRKAIAKYDVETKQHATVVSLDADQGEFPGDLQCSPDGRFLGFGADNGWYYTLDLETHALQRRFRCEHYFAEVDWNATGICYLDKTDDGETKTRAKLMIFDLAKGQPRLVAEGPFADPRWLSESRILVRRANTEFWAYDINTGAGEAIFTEAMLSDVDSAEK